MSMAMKFQIMESAGDRSCLKLIEFELQVRIFIFLEMV